MVCENHTAGELARGHIGAIFEFECWPDTEFAKNAPARYSIRPRRPGMNRDRDAPRTMRRGDLVAEATGNAVSWDGPDIIPFENGLVKHKDLYSDSVSILRQVGLLDWRTQSSGTSAPSGLKGNRRTAAHSP